MYKKIKYFVIFIYLAISKNATAQVGFGTNTPDASAVIDMVSTNKGLLIPRINLTGINASLPVNAPANSLLVFNLFNGNGVTPGYYYYSSSDLKWIRLADDNAQPWKLTGNANTNPAINFIGTIDNQDLVFKRNQIQSGLLNVSNGNTSFGVGALLNGSTPIVGNNLNNVAIGYQSLANNMGSNNTANGSQSLYNNITGSGNVAIGAQSLYKNTIGGINVAIGHQSLYSNTTGTFNAAIGNESLYSNISSKFNLAVGHQSMYSNTVGENNVSIGHQSLNKATVANQNVSLGNMSLYNAVNGSSNTALGTESLYNIVGGNGNVAAGYRSLYNLTGSSSGNIAIGALSGNNLTSGNNNIAIGANTDFASPTGNNQLNLANYIFGTDLSGSLNSPTGKIGIGTASPNSSLHVAGSLAINIKNQDVGYVTDTDYTILVTINLTLPVANLTNKGRILCLVSDIAGAGSATITGTFKERGVITNSYIINNNPGSSSIIIQSTGAEWVILSKY